MTQAHNPAKSTLSYDTGLTKFASNIFRGRLKALDVARGWLMPPSCFCRVRV